MLNKLSKILSILILGTIMSLGKAKAAEETISSKKYLQAWVKNNEGEVVEAFGLTDEDPKALKYLYLGCVFHKARRSLSKSDKDALRTLIKKGLGQ